MIASDKITIRPAARLVNVQEYYFSKKLREIADMKSQGLEVINLGIGSPDLPPHPSVIKALHDYSIMEDNHAYQSYMGIPELRHAFSEWYERFYDVALNPEKEVLPLIGSKEGILHIAMSFLEKGDAALIPNPGYPAYATATRLSGATVIEYKLSAENGWLPDFELLEKEDLSKVKIMWVNYPNMPTGAKAKESSFNELVDFARKHHILIVNDNPYSFILNEDHLSILAIQGAKEVALELNSLSKSHNMAGWRVGMLAGHSDLIQTVLRFKSNMDSGMFRPVQLAAAKALQLPDSWYKELNIIYRMRRKKVHELLDLLDCKWQSDASGMFVWASVPTEFKDGFELSDEILHNAHVFLTPGGIFGTQGNGYIRISLCANEETIAKAISRIKESQKP